MPARWMHDDETEKCLQCLAEFNPIRRKHHCRACGRIFCDDCTCQRLLVPRDMIIYPPANQTTLMLVDQDPCEPQRVCYPCSAVLLPQQEELRRTSSKASQTNFIHRESVERYLNSPLQFSLDAEIRKAAYTLYNFTSDNAIEGADTIPRELIWGAKGLAFLTIVKAGFFFTGRLGSGLVIGRNDDGTWSAPSAIGCTGVGWGFQLGGEVTDVIIVLNSKSALQAFASSAQVSLGTELSVSLGPLGRTAATDVHAGDKGVSAAFSYAHSKGFFVGVSLEAGILVSRTDVNEAFYGGRVSTMDLLMGRVPPPRAAEPLYQALHEVMTADPDDIYGFHNDENRYMTQHRDTRRDTDAPRRYDDSSRHNESSRYNEPSRYNDGSRYSEPSRYNEGPSRAPPSSSLPPSSSSAPRPHYSQADQDFDRTFGQKNSRQPFEERPIRQPQMGPPPPTRDATPYYNDGIGKSDGNRPFDRIRESRSEEEDGEAYLNAKEDEWVEERQRRIEHSNQHSTNLGHGKELDTFKSEVVCHEPPLVSQRRNPAMDEIEL